MIAHQSHGASQPEKVGSNSWIDALHQRRYTYQDMLDAWIAGRAHEEKYGKSEGDAPDFITWLKERSASIDQALPQGGAKKGNDEH